MTKLILAILVCAASSGAAYGGTCNLVFRWDSHAIDKCVRELRSEIDLLQLQIRTIESENRLLRNHLCLIAGDVQNHVVGSDVALIIEDTCTELRAAAKRKAAKEQKSQTPMFPRVGPIAKP